MEIGTRAVLPFSSIFDSILFCLANNVTSLTSHERGMDNPTPSKCSLGIALYFTHILFSQSPHFLNGELYDKMEQGYTT
jgi:hypothetical protein